LGDLNVTNKQTKQNKKTKQNKQIAYLKV